MTRLFHIVNIRHGRRTKYADSFEKETFEAPPGRLEDQRMEVKIDPEDSVNHLVLCRSAQRRSTEDMISSAD
jgi:hypothetical protein